ncbi:MAG: LysM peptidoglycan-binding domain-containing protein [Pseudomonadales bacterium]|nr:LysM peptidoglycan-binding domain-containing protein [Pseudomonadales bacterium]
METLVSQADNSGARFIENRSPEPDQATATGLSAENPSPEPVIPTIPMTANRVVERAINSYLQHRRKLLTLWIERGQTYFPMIEKIFAEEGVPDELKYIALSESDLNPTAKSPMGAAGMWQFMPVTARGAGLRVDDWVDERLDPEKSTRAAARHISELHATYSGRWHLALAGYNCSYRCINRALVRAGGSMDVPPTFWEIYPFLPKETRDFIPKFIAAALLVSNPTFYGINTESTRQEIAYDVVDISGRLSLEEAARLAGTTLSTLRTLNPSLLRNTLPDDDTAFALKIPFGSYESFVRAFRSLPPSKKTAPAEYIVRSGDTLGAIARRHGTSVAALQTSNGIDGHLIHPGRKLLMPGSSAGAPASIVSTERRFVQYDEPAFRPIRLREEFQLVEQQNSTEAAPLMAVSLSITPAVEKDLVVPTIYQVRSGDTLGQIARRFKVSVKDIQGWNHLEGTLIRVNQELTLHAAAASPTTTYQVRRGDSLAAIALRFGVSVDKLKVWNKLSSNLIHPGQNLQMN